MQANPSKFQAMLLNTDQKVPDISIKLSGTCIPIESSVKLLGVNIDSMLKFDVHINTLCKRTARQINALHRVAKYLSQECLINMYHAFIRSNFSYCSSVWHFCSKESTLKLEKIHKRALQVVLNNYSAGYNDMLESIKSPSLYVTRLQSIATEVFKCINGINPPFLNDLFNEASHNYDTRRNMAIQPRVKTTRYGLNTFIYQGSKLWNSIPENLQRENSLENFKFMIKLWKGPECLCGFCTHCSLNNI